MYPWYSVFAPCKEVQGGYSIMFDFREIANNIALMYTLLAIVLLLMYIAFWKKPSEHKHKKK